LATKQILAIGSYHNSSLTIQDDKSGILLNWKTSIKRA